MNIQQSSVRKRLDPRREPYWRALEPGLYVGFRKMAEGDGSNGTWLARWRDPESGKQHWHPIGAVIEKDYATASAEAVTWQVQCRQGVTRAGTVKAALAAYVADCAIVKGGANAADARYCCASIYGDSATAYGRTFGAIRLDKLRVLDVKNFRDALLDGRSKATCNRIMHRIKAGLNFAHRNQMVASDNAWKLVPAYPNADKRREIYLTVTQRRAILKQCSPALADFLTAIMHTGARAGEVARATVGDYSRKDKTLRLVNRKGRGGAERVRHVGLTAAAVELIEAHARLRMPALPLLVNDQGREWNGKHWAASLRDAVTAARKAGADLPRGRIVATCLRHSTITDLVAGGINPGDVARLAGTSIAMIERNYFQGRDTSAIREAIRVV